MRAVTMLPFLQVFNNIEMFLTNCLFKSGGGGGGGDCGDGGGGRAGVANSYVKVDVTGFLTYQG